MANPSIDIRGLYKIFGSEPQTWIGPVKQGMRKEDLVRDHGHVLGLRDINITIPGSKITVVMGLSGSGKSTLIRHINRLIDPTAGEIVIGGTDILKLSRQELQMFRRHRTAMVFQKFALLPHRNILENTVYGLELQGLPRTTQVQTAMHWLERVGLKGFEAKFPNQLSGGMQQRVGLARALCTDAEILLMDEAYSALDPLIRVDMQTVLLELQQELKKTVVFITHDLDEALRLGDKIVILRDGQIVQQGTAQDIVLRPADEYITSFVRHVNRSRVVTVDAVMRPLGSADAADAIRIPADMVLEGAVRMLMAGGMNGHGIVERDGSPVGSVALQQVIGEMISGGER